MSAVHSRIVLQEHQIMVAASSDSIHSPVPDIDPTRPPQLEMNILRSRTGCVCAGSRQIDQDSDSMSATTAVEHDDYYDSEFDPVLYESSAGSDQYNSVPGYEYIGPPLIFPWLEEQVDAADIADGNENAGIHLRRVHSIDSMDVEGWGGASPAASMMLQELEIPDISMADSGFSFPPNGSELVRHTGCADTFANLHGNYPALIVESLEDETAFRAKHLLDGRT